MQVMAVIRPLRPLRAASGKSGKPVIESRLQDFVVITGFSGAGKSTAMNVFEMRATSAWTTCHRR
jgi:putative protein kinase ArgK-like GTPase of G3E family